LEELNGFKRLFPLKLIHDLLKGAVSKAHDKYKSGDWSIGNVKSYLKAHRLNEFAREAVVTKLRIAIDTKW
jgi:hypothetical protein